VPAPRSGAIGVGTWRTQAEFKDIKVTRGNETLFTCDFADGTKGWRLHGGDWTVEGGALQQKALAENIRAFAGDKSWDNYTYSLKARKLGGAEGFLIPFLIKDEEAKAWWNIGGWGNTRHAIELDGISGHDVEGSIETGKWYDIRIEVQGANVKCFLDGKLIHDASYQATKPLYAVASLAKRANEVILKVVNVSAADQETDLRLEGTRVRPTAKAIVLVSDKPEDENTLEQPTKIKPVTLTLNNASAAFHHTFPANSVTVLRLKLQ
jgi:alpha-L-arabinofuranosidase